MLNFDAGDGDEEADDEVADERAFAAMCAE